VSAVDVHIPIVVMGVSGCGKTTMGALLAQHLGGTFLDADDLHSEEARRKMAGGTPLTDEDRAPWLDRVGRRMAELSASGARPVVACSALRRRYRDQLRARAGEVFFLHLDGEDAVLDERLRGRSHFMPASLLQSQRATLEALADDERGCAVSVAEPPSALIPVLLGAVRGMSGTGADELPRGRSEYPNKE